MNGPESGSTPPPGDEPEVAITRHEERAEVDTETQVAGRVRIRTHVEDVPSQQVVSRNVEHVDTSERVPASEHDSGEVEVLEDGSLSIPVLEEVLVVTKKLVVRERVIVRKHTVVEEQTVETVLRREQVTVEADDGVEVEYRDRETP